MSTPTPTRRQLDAMAMRIAPGAEPGELARWITRVSATRIPVEVLAQATPATCATGPRSAGTRPLRLARRTATGGSSRLKSTASQSNKAREQWIRTSS